MADDTPALSPATVVVHAGRPPRDVDQPLNTPITMASTYVAGGDLEYGRYANPTWAAFEEALGALEGGRALAFSSGLAAVSTVLDLVGQDALVVAPRHAYLGSIGQLGDLESRGRIGSTLVDIADTDAVVAALDDAAILWIESPTNPALEVADVETLVRGGPRGRRPGRRRQHLRHAPAAAAARARRRHRAALGDQVPRRPQRRRDGRARGPRHQLYDVLKGRRDLIGAIPGTLEAWLALRGLRTLHLRVERAQANAAELVRRLASHPAIEPVRYPGFGAIVAAVLADRRGRRPADPLHVAVGARHLARQRRVDVRTPPALEGRGPDHPRGSRPDVRRHRGRRRPLGRPRAGPCPRSPLSRRSQSSFGLASGVAGDEGLHRVGGGHLAGDDGVDGLGDRARTRPHGGRRACSDAQDLAPSATWRVEA